MFHFSLKLDNKLRVKRRNEKAMKSEMLKCLITEMAPLLGKIFVTENLCVGKNDRFCN